MLPIGLTNKNNPHCVLLKKKSYQATYKPILIEIHVTVIDHYQTNDIDQLIQSTAICQLRAGNLKINLRCSSALCARVFILNQKQLNLFNKITSMIRLLWVNSVNKWHTHEHTGFTDSTRITTFQSAPIYPPVILLKDPNMQE